MTKKPTYEVLERRIRALEDQSIKGKRVEESLRESEEKYRALFNNQHVAICIFNLETHKFLDVNDAYVRLYGYNRQELLGDMNIHDITAEPEESDRSMQRTKETGTTFIPLQWHRKKDGAVFPVEIVGEPYLWKGEEVMFAMVIDITERRRAEEALRKSEEMLRLITENMSDMIRVTDLQGRNLYASPSHLKGLGYRQEDRVGKSGLDLVHPKDVEKIIDVYSRGLASNQFMKVEYRVKHADGHYVWLETIGDILRDTEGKATAVVMSSRDITKRKQAEDALQESEENFRTFFDTMNDMIIVGSPDGKIFYTNPAITQKLGYSLDELKNMHVLDVHPAEKRQEAETIFAAMFRGELDICPLPLQGKTGVLVPVETRAWFGRWSGADCIFGICKDLTREQEAMQKFNRLFNSNPTPMAVSSLPARRFTDVNDAFLNVLGYSRTEVIGKTSAELGLIMQPDKHQEIADRLQVYGHVANRELKIKCKSGAILSGLFSGEIIESQGEKYFLTVMIDQTERKRTEEELEKHRRHLEVLVKERTAELEIKNITLQELNTALRVLLKQREDDKKDMEERFVMNVRNLILPHVEQMKKGHLDIGQRSCVNIIETHLNEITTPLLKNIRQFNLTPAEIKVAALVRRGKSTKEIAEILGTARGSIDVHRKKIRSKLGLSNRKANLLSHLENLEQ